MPVGQLTNEVADDFPTSTRPGGKFTRQLTDVDIVLKDLESSFDPAAGTPTKALKFLDYTKDENGETVTKIDEDTGEVVADMQTARMRASARVQQLKGRGYSTDAGWVIKAVDGTVWAKFYGAGNVPAKGKDEDAESAAA